jgi:hypothetical protein
VKILTLLLLAFLSCPQSSTTQQPTSAAESAISAEGLGIYRDFLNFYIGKGSAKLNLVETTTIFTADDFDDDCLKAFLLMRSARRVSSHIDLMPQRRKAGPSC